LLSSEIKAAIEELKLNKSEGIDNMPANMIKNLGEQGNKELVKLCQDIGSIQECYMTRRISRNSGNTNREKGTSNRMWRLQNN
jgi:hypothetical protein